MLLLPPPGKCRGSGGRPSLEAGHGMQLNFHGKTNDDNGEKIAVSQAAISYGPAGR